MKDERTYETQRIDHLGIVSGICQEISLIEQIDTKVKPNGRKVSCGRATQALVLNALGFVGSALYLMPDYLDQKPVDLLIDPDLTAEDFNDDTLGRCLDDLYEAGRTVRETLVALQYHPDVIAGIVVNRVVQSKDYCLQEGDDVMLFAVMGGG